MQSALLRPRSESVTTPSRLRSGELAIRDRRARAVQGDISVADKELHLCSGFRDDDDDGNGGGELTGSFAVGEVHHGLPGVLGEADESWSERHIVYSVLLLWAISVRRAVQSDRAERRRRKRSDLGKGATSNWFPSLAIPHPRQPHHNGKS